MRFFLKYAAVTIVVFTPWLIVMHIIGRFKTPFQESSPLDLISLLINLVILYFGINEATRESGKKIGFKQIFKIGVKLSLVFAGVIALIFALYYRTLNQNLINYVIKVNKLDGSARARLLIYDTILQFGSAFFSSLVFSLAISLTLVLKNRKKVKS